jgi:hypothetical protein
MIHYPLMKSIWMRFATIGQTPNDLGQGAKTDCARPARLKRLGFFRLSNCRCRIKVFRYRGTSGTFRPVDLSRVLSNRQNKAGKDHRGISHWASLAYFAEGWCK